MESVGFYNLGFIQDDLRGGVLSAQCNNRHAAGYEHKFIPIQTCMQSLSSFYKRYLEHEPVKHRHAIDFYEMVGWACHPSPVLLFELNLFGSCSTSHYSPAVQQLALRVFPAETRLTVYRRMHIPVKVARPRRPSGTNLWHGDV